MFFSLMGYVNNLVAGTANNRRHEATSLASALRNTLARAGRKSIDHLTYLSGNLITINTGKLEKGIYLYNITIKRGDNGKGKLIIAQ
ncbi:MAG: hypothetical protein POELPBGB_01663 [Bacteroidia bacterium]|nr:hypothetical protein [Bacteroidia bacterium]